MHEMNGHARAQNRQSALSNFCRFLTNCFSCFQSTADDNEHYTSRGANAESNKSRSQAVSKMYDGPGERAGKTKNKKGTSQQIQLLSSMPTPENPHLTRERNDLEAGEKYASGGNGLGLR